MQELGVSLYIKRDDMTGGVELGGNKVRKLEFLLADASANGNDSVVTIGGEQSNHCRATAAAARMIGMEPNLILRTRRANAVQQDFGFVGNILFDRMVGSTIFTCTPGEYGRIGSEALVKKVCEHLESIGKKPYGIPVGGSNGLGSWGYIKGVEELEAQWNQEEGSPALDHVVFACGSGGTAAGIALGLAMCESLSPQVHAVGVCDDPDYFYDYVAGIAEEMGLESDEGGTLDFIQQHMTAHQGKGLGYASSTPEELEFVSQFSLETGIALDPVYSGKALFHFVTKVLTANPDDYRGKNILFWHTGGALGMYDKGNDLSLDTIAPVYRLDVYGNDGGGRSITI
uniref:Tryptophan synthase beta chain-like PALP domain-containing protein n=1 Tax=Cyclophora tenuis TaxID=216820 RepID=A0A7S1CYU7_CYCTE